MHIYPLHSVQFQVALHCGQRYLTWNTSVSFLFFSFIIFAPLIVNSMSVYDGSWSFLAPSSTSRRCLEVNYSNQLIKKKKNSLESIDVFPMFIWKIGVLRSSDSISVTTSEFFSFRYSLLSTILPLDFLFCLTIPGIFHERDRHSVF